MYYALRIALLIAYVATACRTVQDRDAIVADLNRRFVTGRPDSDSLKQDFIGGSLRLIFHDAGTYDMNLDNGRPSGCIADESLDHENAGLSRVIDLLDPVFQSFIDVCPSRGDFWVLAAAAAVDAAMRATGSSVSLVNGYQWGRDFETECSLKAGRLPGHREGLTELRNVFTLRMGFSDQEIVALMGAHTIGRSHMEFSGMDGAWDTTMMTFDNLYYVEMLDGQGGGEWARARVKESDLHNWVDPRFQNSLTGVENIMLNTDMCLAFDFGQHNSDVSPKTAENSCQINWPEELKRFIDPNAPWEAVAPDGSGQCPELVGTSPRTTVNQYATNQAQFQQDFANVYQKLTSLGYSNTLCEPCTSNTDCCCNGNCVLENTPSPADDIPSSMVDTPSESAVISDVTPPPTSTSSYFCSRRLWWLWTWGLTVLAILV